MQESLKETKTNQSLNVGILISLSVLLITRLLPFAKAPLFAYGYDYGFYAFAANNAVTFSWNSLITGIGGGFNSPVFYLGHILHIPPFLIVNELYFIFAILGGLALAWFYKDKKTGIFAILLYAFSLIQIEAYTMYLWKTVIAIPFMLLGLKALREKQWKRFIIYSLLVLLIHRTSAIFYFLTVAVYFVVQLIKNKRWIMLVGGLTAGLAVFLIFSPQIRLVAHNLLDNNNFDVRTGLFLQYQNVFSLIWPLVVLSLPGIYLSIRRKQNFIPLLMLGITAAWFFLKLPFYRRTLMYVDLGLIMSAAYFLGQITYTTYKKIALAIVLLFLAYRAGQFTLQKYPLIQTSEVNEIKQFNGHGFVLAVSANDAPWLLAFTKNVRLGAPGLFEDPHTFDEWQQFWAGQNQQMFLSKYPRPLYLYERDYPLMGLPQKCLNQISQNFFQYTCP